MSGRVLGHTRLPEGTRARVVLTDEAIEVDEAEGADVNRHRVLLDDVLAVTLHEQRRVGFLVTMGLIVLAMAGLALAILFDGPGVQWQPAAAIFGVFGMPALLAFLLHLSLGVRTVTVYGRRSRARVGFLLRRDRARRVRDLVCQAVRDSQSR